MDNPRGSPRFDCEAATWLIALTFERSELWVFYSNIEVGSIKLGSQEYMSCGGESPGYNGWCINRLEDGLQSRLWVTFAYNKHCYKH